MYQITPVTFINLMIAVCICTSPQLASSATIDADANPDIPYKWWKVEEHRNGGQFTWNKETVNLYFSDRQRDGMWTDGHDFREQLKDQPVLNANVLDYLLKHQDLIPKEWKGRKICFWGTIYRNVGKIDRDEGFGLIVRYLYYDDNMWNWRFHYLIDVFGTDSPAVLSSR